MARGKGRGGKLAVRTYGKGEKSLTLEKEGEVQPLLANCRRGKSEQIVTVTKGEKEGKKTSLSTYSLERKDKTFCSIPTRRKAH